MHKKIMHKLKRVGLSIIAIHCFTLSINFKIYSYIIGIGPYSKVKEWVQSQLSIIFTVSLRLRGIQKKIKSLPFENKAAFV